MLRATLCISGLLLLAFAGCTAEQTSPTPQQSAEQSAPAAEQPPAAQAPAPPAAQPAPPAAPPRQAAPKPETRAETAVPESPPADTAARAAAAPPQTAAPPQAQQLADRAQPAAAEPPPAPRFATVPSGTRLEIRLTDPVSSAVAQSGDSFESTLDQDLEVDGRVLAPRGSVVSGKLSNVRQSGRVEGRATLSMTLTEVRIGGQGQPIRTNTLSFEAEGTEKKDATKIGIGAGVGALIGAIAGGGKGAAIGAAIGGGAGTATVLATKGKEVEFEAEQLFSFVLREDVQIRLP